MQKEILRRIPAVNTLLGTPAVQELLGRWPREKVVEAIRQELALLREESRADGDPAAKIARMEEELGWRLEARLSRRNLRRVINATGIIVHTNLGRSLLPAAAREALEGVAFHYSNLEYDLSQGRRGSRHAHLSGLLQRITGAEAGIAVNNNAAAVLLCLDTLAAGREVVVSRGQLVEIGGSFRIPEVMAKSGARLVEIGTTNKTHLEDYRRAVTPETAMLLKVHTSNFKILGFTEEVPVSELVTLGRERGVLVMEDLGSGVLVDLAQYGLPPEPMVQASVAAGVDLVTFSGDKLLGGPQAGIIVGKKELVDRIAKNPLARALRLDKMTLAALEVTLQLYIHPELARREIPTLEMLTRPLAQVAEAAERLAGMLSERLAGRVEVAVIDDASEAGGGSLPSASIPGKAVAILPREISCELLETRLRAQEPPVIARIHKDRVLLNVRTVAPNEEPEIATAIERAFGGEEQRE
ncbi:MAG: L-seryl-tRNA(Sec) selenium transferase [Syntrophothermus sp.]